MKTYLLPSSGAYLECLRPFAFLMTRTGLPPRQSLASAPSLLTGVLQFMASALVEEKTKTQIHLSLTLNRSQIYNCYTENYLAESL